MIKIYGASDDLIEVEGDISEEFPALGDEGFYLAFSEGTLLRVRYDNDGVWRIHLMAHGRGTVEINHCTVVEDNNYTDVAMLDCDNPIRWVMMGAHLATR